MLLLNSLITGLLGPWHRATGCDLPGVGEFYPAFRTVRPCVSTLQIALACMYSHTRPPPLWGQITHNEGIYNTRVLLMNTKTTERIRCSLTCPLQTDPRQPWWTLLLDVDLITYWFLLHHRKPHNFWALQQERAH